MRPSSGLWILTIAHTPVYKQQKKITKRIFGIRPKGFTTFSIEPKLPEGWSSMALRNIKAFNHTFDIEVKKEKDKLSIRVLNEDEIFLDTRIGKNETIKVKLGQNRLTFS